MKLGNQIASVFERIQRPLLAAMHQTRGQAAQTAEAEASVPLPRPRPLPDIHMREAKNRLAALIGDGLRTQDGLKTHTINAFSRVIPPRASVTPQAAEAYRNLEGKMHMAYASLYALDKLPLKSFAGTPLPSAANTSLVDAITAQHGLYQAAKELQQASDRNDPALIRIMADSQARSSELLNMAARMVPVATSEGWKMNLPEGMQPLDANTTVLEAMNVLSTHMHGTETLLYSLTEQANPLFAEVDALAKDDSTLSPSVFTEKLLSVKQNILEVQRAVEKLKNPGAEDTLVLKGDEASFLALEERLSAALERLKALEGTPDFREVATKYAEALADVPNLWELAEKLPISEALKDMLGGVDAGAENIKELLLSNVGTKFDIAHLSREIIKEQDERSRDVAVYKTFVTLVHQYTTLGDDISPEKFAQGVQKRLPALNVGEQHALAADIAEAVDALQNDPEGLAQIGTIKDVLTHSIFSLAPAQIRSELRELKRLSSRADETVAHRGQYIAKAFENNFSLSTLAEVSARGIDPACVDFVAHDGALVGTPTPLGSGVCNTVFLCTYKDAHGMETQRVFKGEVQARRGLAKLRLGKLGYDPLVRVAQINVATKQVAAAIQAGNVVSQATVGVHNGQFGLFMEPAPGKTAASFSEAGPDSTIVATTKDGVQLNAEALYAHLRETNLMPTVRANMQRELSKLEWADLLTGQGDRHPENYLVDINPDTGAVRVTGIDNDASFGRLMVGMAQVDVTAYPKLHDMATSMRVGNADRLIVDFMDMNDTEKERLHAIFGFNQMFVPELIDRSTLDALMAIDESAYRAMLEPNLDPQAVDSAMLRLEDAKTWATSLKEAGRVVDDWEHDTIPENPENLSGKRVNVSEMLTRIGNHLETIGSSDAMGFYLRDFDLLLQ